jgi:ferric-dicitrate binding protein FerR (iron transport regulator)
VAIDNIPISGADARRLACADWELLRHSDAPGFRPHRAQLRLEVALRNGLGERETERLQQLTEPQTLAAHWRRRARSAWRTTRLAVAAGALSATAMGALSVWHFVLSPRTEVAVELQAVGQEYRHVLQDGSSIVLHPGTIGRLDAHAGDVVFELTRGFAEFEVTRIPGRRWDVTAAGYRVSVVGTRFGVRYEPDSPFQVDVQRGAVAVQIPEQDSVLQLAAGDALTATEHEVTLRHGKLETALVEPFGSGSSSNAESGAVDESAQSADATSTAESVSADVLSLAAGARRPAVHSGMTGHSGVTGQSGVTANGAQKSSHELQLLSRARQAVAAGDYRSAMHWMDTHARRYPRGQLVEEREALRVEALRGMGNAEAARRAAGEFRERFPKSVLSPQMSTSEAQFNKSSSPR